MSQDNKAKREEAALAALSETRARMVSFKVPGVEKPAILFFASLILRMEPLVDWSIPSAATDGDKLYLNPDWFLSLQQGERFTVMAHEVAHVAQLHHLRQGDRRLEPWNIAGDMAINSWLVEAGFQMPDCGIVPGRGKYTQYPPGQSAEHYYDLLTKKEDKDDGDSDDGGGGGSGKDDKQQPQQQPKQQPDDGDGEDEGDGGDAGGGDQGDDGEGDQQGEDGPSQQPGSGRNAPDPGGMGAVIQSPADQAERSEKEGKVKVAIVQAAQAAKSQGKAPGWMARMIEQVMVPKQDWRQILRDFVTRQARNDYSYQRPNRRYLQQGVIMPTLRGEDLGDVIVTVDCSGSIGQKELDVFAGELSGIVDTYNCKVTILYHDIPVTHVQQWEPSDGPLKLTPHGGGGTSHVPVFEHIERQLKDDDAPCVVAFTDLYTDFPSKAPRLPVLWTVYGNSHCSQADVPFGQVVKIEG